MVHPKRSSAFTAAEVHANQPQSRYPAVICQLAAMGSHPAQHLDDVQDAPRAGIHDGQQAPRLAHEDERPVLAQQRCGRRKRPCDCLADVCEGSMIYFAQRLGSRGRQRRADMTRRHSTP